MMAEDKNQLVDYRLRSPQIPAERYWIMIFDLPLCGHSLFFERSLYASGYPGRLTKIARD